MVNRSEKKFDKLLDEDLYARAKKAVAHDEFIYNLDVKAYIDFYELMIPPERSKFDDKRRENE